jgi:hypothetical protein
MDPKRENHIFKLSAIQTICSIIIEGILYPIDTLRNKIINNTKEHLSLYRGFKKFYKSEGIRTFFTGISVVMPTNIVSNFSWLYTYEHMNKFQYGLIDKTINNNNNKKKLKRFVPMFSSAFAELLSNFLYLPLDIVKIRMQVQSNSNSNYKRLFSTIYEIYHKEGLRRFYSISYLSLSFSVLKTSLFCLVYENLRKYILESRDTNINKLSFPQTVFVSGFAVLVNSLIFNPIEVMLVRYQTSDSTKNILKARLIILDIIKNESLLGLYKGFALRVFINVIGSIMYFSVYEHYRTKYGFIL